MFQEITDKTKWNEFINNSSTTDILQTWEWGETKRVEGWKPFKFALMQDNNIKIAAQVLLKQVKLFGNLAYIPHGPVFAEYPDYLKAFKSNEWEVFMKELKKWASKNRVFVIELEPKAAEELFSSSNLEGIVITNRNRQPKYKLLIDLSKTDDEVLSGMKKNTRYNISYAQRKGVKVKSYSVKEVLGDPAILDKFYELVMDMQKRTKGYPVRSKAYFAKLFEAYKDTNALMIFEASFEKDVIAMNISEFTNTWASSFYAGSNRLHPNMKAPYLLRWESIKEAKNRGCKVYDFWGIVPESKHHKGYSDHKLSFGGDRIDFVGILAIPMSAKAALWELVLKLQKLFVKFKYS